jgi:Flp pilus assembly protein TadG
MAILSPFLVFLFLVTIDFCRVYHCTQTVKGCAEAGVLYASGTAMVDSNTSPAEAATQAAVAEGTVLDPPVQSSDVNVHVGGGSAMVTVNYKFKTICQYPGLPQTLNLASTVQMSSAPKPGDGN